MERILLDANALLSFVTDRDPRQQEKIYLLFQKALHGELEIGLHQQSLSEMIFVLRNVYNLELPMISELLGDLVEEPGTIPVNELNWKALLQLWPDPISDFVDAVLASVARSGKWKIATFDKSFQKHLKRLKVETI